MKRIILFAFIACCLAGCSTFYSAVDKGKDNIFEDNTLIIEKQLTPLEVKLEITNKTDKKAEVLWNKCRYIDLAGKSFEVIHSGTIFKENGNVYIPPVIIAAGETYTDFITPTDALINRKQLHEYNTEMWATHHKTTNQIYIVDQDIDYRNRKELEDFIGKQYEIHLVFNLDSEELTYDLKGTITEIIDLSKQ